MLEANYSATVIDHFERPRNAGRLPAAPDVITGSAGDPERGVLFTLSARIAGDAIQTMRFAAYGCPHCVAAASWLTQRMLGCARAAVHSCGWREIATALQVPAEKRGRLLILEDALQAMAEDWARKS